MPIDKIFTCQARKKITLFFHQNPNTVDTINGIITWTGLTKKETIKALEELVDLGVLMAHRTSSTVGYAYTTNKKLIARIKKYFKLNKQ